MREIIFIGTLSYNVEYEHIQAHAFYVGLSQ